MNAQRSSAVAAQVRAADKSNLAVEAELAEAEALARREAAQARRPPRWRAAAAAAALPLQRAGGNHHRAPAQADASPSSTRPSPSSTALRRSTAVRNAAASAGIVDDLKRCRSAAGAAVRSATRACSSKKQRVRVRLAGASSREYGRPADVPCWEFLCAFRGSAVLPLNSEAGHLMLPETRLDEFAAALQAPHAELQRRPAHANQYRYLQHLHVELLKVLFNDDGTDAWWPKPAKRHAGPESNLQPDFNVRVLHHGPRWWERPLLPGEEKTRRPNGSTPKPKAPAPAYAAPPPALAASSRRSPRRAPLSSRRRRRSSSSASAPPEIQAAVAAQARQAFAASCAMMNGGAGPTRARPSPPRLSPSRCARGAAAAGAERRRRRAAAGSAATPPPACVAAAPPPACVAAALPPAAPPAEALAPVEAEPNVAVLVPGRRRQAEPPAAGAARQGGAARRAACAARACRAGRACRAARAGRAARQGGAAAAAAEAPAPAPRRRAAAPAATPEAAAASAGAAADGALASAAAARASASATSDEAAVAAAATPRRPELSPAANRRRTPNGRGAGSAKGSKGSRARKPLSEAAQAALPLKLGDLVALLKADAKTRDAPRPPVAVVGPSTWAMVAAAAAARLADRAHATASAAVAAHDAVGASEDLGDFAPHRRPPGADAATRQHFEDAHRAVAEGREPPTDATKPAEEPKDEGLPLRGASRSPPPWTTCSRAASTACSRRSGAALPPPPTGAGDGAAAKVLDDRARRLGSAEGALLQHRVRKKHEDYLKMRRAVSAARTDLDLNALPRRRPPRTRPTTAGATSPPRSSAAWKPRCAAPEGTPADYDWRLRPLATAAQALRAREAADADAAAAKSDAVALGKLPPLRADHVGRDGGGHCYWAFRGERDYGYAPHRVWVQQAPGAPKATPPAPSWGYFGDDKQVANLAASSTAATRPRRSSRSRRASPGRAPFPRPPARAWGS
ncbi:hypothetical protein JL721_10780 [Aureococcus anophagefferens]|nr:hypothetical protein JL721_10780 [Aureococcus anophagefferens]